MRKEAERLVEVKGFTALTAAEATAIEKEQEKEKAAAKKKSEAK